VLARIKDHFEFPLFIQEWRAQRAIARMTAGRGPSWFFTGVPLDRMASFERDLDSLVKEIAASGATPVLVTHATRYQDPLDATDQRLLRQWRQLTPRATESAIVQFDHASAEPVERVAAKNHVPVVKAADAMTGHREYFVDSAHFTDLGAGVLAGLVSRAVLSVTPSSHAGQGS
jgi:hypothetical protein